MADLEAVLQAICGSVAKLRATVQKMMREREKRKSAFRLKFQPRSTAGKIHSSRHSTDDAGSGQREELKGDHVIRVIWWRR
jgi:hypothetical protein